MTVVRRRRGSMGVKATDVVLSSSGGTTEVSLYGAGYVYVGESFLTTQTSVFKKVTYQLKKVGSPTGAVSYCGFAWSGVEGDSLGNVYGDLILGFMQAEDLTTEWQDIAVTTTGNSHTAGWQVPCFIYSGGDASNYVAMQYGGTGITAMSGKATAQHGDSAVHILNATQDYNCQIMLRWT